MTIVAGVDFGTLSVRVSILDSERGRLGTAVAQYPLHRKREDPDYATQSHTDHMRGLAEATRAAVKAAAISGDQVAAIALDTTGSSVVPVDAQMQPLSEYYLWCDHRATAEAQEITALAHKENLEAIEWCGGVYSHEWGFAKLLHWLRHNPEKRAQFASAFEHCDMIAATLCGITDPHRAKRSVCAMGHKWMWNPKWGGLPPQSFLSKVDPLMDGIRDKLAGEYLTSDHPAGHLAPEWAGKLGLRAGIPIPVGAFDAHWDALGAGCREGDVVNVVGTSTCIIAMAPKRGSSPAFAAWCPAACIRSTPALKQVCRRPAISSKPLRRARAPGSPSFERAREISARTNGSVRLSWDNGDRTVLVNSELGGVTLGWNLLHTAQDELFAAIEGTAFHTRIILERMAEYGTPVERVINGGGVPQNNPV